MLEKLGEPMYLLESNPTVERIAKLIYDQGRALGVDISSSAIAVSTHGIGSPRAAHAVA